LLVSFNNWNEKKKKVTFEALIISLIRGTPNVTSIEKKLKI